MERSLPSQKAGTSSQLMARLFAAAVHRKLVSSVGTVVVAVTQKVLLHTQPVAAVPLTLRARELA